MSKVKVQLYQLCKEYIDKAISEIETVITERREAMHNETKSSMGDKYETSREILQQDINMNMTRLSKLKEEEAVLNRIQPDVLTTRVTDGSLVYTTNGNFYIAISAGKLKIANELYYAISITSPIGQQLKVKKAGEELSLNNRSYKILKVY